MRKILPEDVSLKKQKFINYLEKLNANQAGKLLRRNILNYFHGEEDANFCPYQVVLCNFNNIYVEDAIAQQSRHDRYRFIMEVLLQYGADMNKVVQGKTVLTYEFEELPSKLSRFNSRTHFWVVKQAILHGMYSLDNAAEEDKSVKCSLKAKAKRLVKSLPLVFILYCFKRKKIATKL